MQPCLSQVCTLPAPITSELEDYAAGKCDAIELWMTKVEEHLRESSLDDFKQLLASHQIRPLSAAYQGGLLASQGERRAEAWKLFERRLALCQQLGVEVMVVACDVPAPMTSQDAQRVQASLGQVAQQAEAAQVKVALEFQASSALGNNLQTAVALTAPIGSAHLGICLDAFHYHIGPSKPEDLELLSTENLFVVQLCDLADVPRELATDQHRILPGEGEIAIEPIIARLRDIDYQGPVTTELLNPQIWQVPPRQFGEIAMTSLRLRLGIAEQ